VLIRAFIQDYLAKHPVTDAQLKKDYEEIKSKLGGKEYKARHILVEKEAEAKAIIARLKKGGKFEDIAKKQSKDPGSGANGGDLDWSTPDSYVPEFGQAMVKLSKGQTTDAPIKTQFGWHIIRLDDVRTPQLPGFDQVKPQLQQQMTQQKLGKYQEELRAKAKIE
jgi:peptidyl-prolyl cis-trans isomerase C